MDRLFQMIMIDDEDTVLYNIAHSFDWQAMGFRLAGTFNRAANALAFIRDNPVDLVVSDIKMPQMSGLALAKTLSENYPDIVVVLLSGYKDFEYAKEALQYGVGDYILKPVAYAEVQSVFKSMYEKLVLRHTPPEEDTAFPEAVPITLQKAISDYFDKKAADYSDIEAALQKSGIDLAIANAPVTTISATLTDLEEYLQDTWTHGRDRLFAAIKNLACTQDILLIPSKYLLFDKIEFIAIAKTPDPAQFQNSLLAFQNEFTSNCFEMLSLAAVVKINRITKNLYALVMHEELEKSVSVDVSILMKHIAAGDLAKTESILAESMAQNAGSEAYLSSFAYALYRELIERIAFQDLIAFHLYPEELVIPVTFDGYLFPEQIGVMCRYLPNTVMHSARYFASNPQDNGSIIEKSKNYIHAHYMEPISLTMVANHVFLSEAHLSRCFKKEVGQNFIDYLVSVRIQHAQDLLLTTKHNMNKICEMVGYISLRYFYRRFKAQTGFTPQEYRKKFAVPE